MVCGWGPTAQGANRWMFTKALVEVLDECINESFSVAMVHHRLYYILSWKRPEALRPFFLSTSVDPRIPSINLSRLVAHGLKELTSTTSAGQLKPPHVLMLVVINNERVPDTKVCRHWLASYPALSKYANV
jgi:hypothetical protein